MHFFCDFCGHSFARFALNLVLTVLRRAESKGAVICGSVHQARPFVFKRRELLRAT